MAAAKLSSQDRKDLDKFTKYLVYKCIQVIVQSRLEDKVHMQSKPFSSGSDWFNLAIKDIPEVLAETKRVFTSGSLDYGQNICVEISLKTTEGETMILETWWLTLTDSCDPAARVCYTVYNRMGILLKSLFGVSRAIPAYHLSRKQGPDSYLICYRLYEGEPQLNCLGDCRLSSKVGAVPTPIGTISLSVACRTKMLISPHQSIKDMSVDLKVDHFTSEFSPKRKTASKPCHVVRRDRKSSLAEDGLMFGDPPDIYANSFSVTPPEPHGHYLNQGVSPSHRTTHQRPVADNNYRPDEPGNERLENQISLSHIHRMGAFAPLREAEQKTDEDIPFASLLLPLDTVDTNANRKVTGTDTTDAAEINDNISHSTGSVSSRSTISQNSAPDDFVMIELKTPFAVADGNSDLGRFYRDCQGAPALSMFEQSNTVQDTMNSITDQLANFESTAHDFDDFVNSLQTTED